MDLNLPIKIDMFYLMLHQSMLYCSDSNNTKVNGISLRSTEVNVIDMFSLTLFYFARMVALTTESSLP
jgi:hypothetical protein